MGVTFSYCPTVEIADEELQGVLYGKLFSAERGQFWSEIIVLLLFMLVLVQVVCGGCVHVCCTCPCFVHGILKVLSSLNKSGRGGACDCRLTELSVLIFMLPF